MREFEAKIGAWRKAITSALPDQPETVRELEAHLRDDIAARCRAGVTADTAFELAAQRLGEPRGLAREFARVRAPWWPQSWVLRGILILVTSFGMTLLVMIGSGLSAQRLTPLLGAHVLAATMGYLASFCAGLVGFTALVRAWRRPLTPAQLRELNALMFRLTCVSVALVPIGMVLGMIWARENLGAAWSWQRTEAGAFFVLVATVLLFVVQTSVRVSDWLRFAIALLGATAVAFGMLGARAVTPAVPITWLVLAFAFSQGAVAFLRHQSQKATS
jgi:hypothetical protein